MGFLNRIFGSKPKLPPIDLSILGTDFHSHLIPGIDDGADTLETSLDLIKGLVNHGYKKIITTPHVMVDYYRNTPEIILGGLEKVRAAIKEGNIEVEIEAAAEYYLDQGFEDILKSDSLLTFGDNYVLFEVSYMNPPQNLDHTIFELQTNGYKPILAHPERYPFWYKEFDKYHRLKEKGVFLQMNITSLTGQYSEETKKIAERMIDEELIEFIGSDTHHQGHIDLIEKCKTNPHLHKLINSGKLLNASL